MQSAVLSGDVQQQNEVGEWRTVLTASGFVVRDRRLFPEYDRLDATRYMYSGFVWAPYVPGKAGAFRPY